MSVTTLEEAPVDVADEQPSDRESDRVAHIEHSFLPLRAMCGVPMDPDCRPIEPGLADVHYCVVCDELWDR